MACYEAYQNALGIRSIAFPPRFAFTSSSAVPVAAVAPAASFLALGSFDGKVRLLSMYSWQLAFALPLVHPKELDAGFSAYRSLLLTVEVAASHSAGVVNSHLKFASAQGGASRAALDAQDDELEEEEEGVGAGEQENEEGNTVDNASSNALRKEKTFRQIQLGSSQQLLQCSVLRAKTRYISSTHQDNGTAAAELAQLHLDRSKATANAVINRGADDDKLGSYFTLRATKSLPKAHLHQPDLKKNTAMKRTTATTIGGMGGMGAAGAGGLPTMGVSWIGWSSGTSNNSGAGANAGAGAVEALLACRDEGHPRCLWIWKPLKAELLAVLVQLDAITSAQWRPSPQPTVSSISTASTIGELNTSSVIPPSPPPSPTKYMPITAAGAGAVLGKQQEGQQQEEADVLAYCTGTGRVYFWSPSIGASYADLSAVRDRHGNSVKDLSFAIMSLRWSEDGMSLILKGKEAHCICSVSYKALVLHKA